MRSSLRERPNLGHSGQGRGVGIGSPGFGGGAPVYFDEPGDQAGHTPRIESPPNRPQQNRPPSTPESLQKTMYLRGAHESTEPLHEWFCKGADMTSPAKYEAALYQLEEYPPDICQYNDNIRDERWTHFSLEGVRFPAATVDVIGTSHYRKIAHHPLATDFKGRSLTRASIVGRGETSA